MAFNTLGLQEPCGTPGERNGWGGDGRREAETVGGTVEFGRKLRRKVGRNQPPRAGENPVCSWQPCTTPMFMTLMDSTYQPVVIGFCYLCSRNTHNALGASCVSPPSW